MKNAFLGGSFTEKYDNRACFIAEHGRKSGSDRYWNRASYNGRRAQKTCLRVYQVHRAAFSFRTSGRFSVKLSDHGFEVPAFCQVMAVRAVASEYLILQAQGPANSHC